MQKNLKLDDWQKEVLEAEGNILLCTGRQVGKTTIFARKAAERMINQEGSRIIIVSLTEDQAKLIIVMILDYLERNYKSHIAKGKDKPTQNRVILKNKSSCLARPVGTTGDAVRGFTGDVLLIDEASRMPELVWDAGKPTLLTTAGDIWMCSTPFGKKGYFYEAYLNKDERFKVFHISSEEVIKNRPISDSWSQEKRDKAIKFLEDEKESMSQLRYGQEYLGLFLDDLRQYFDDKLIDRVCTAKRPNNIKKDGEYFMGVDIARMGDDESTFEILRRIHKKKYVQVENITTKKTLTTTTERRIIELSRAYKPKKIYIDAGAGTLGVSIFDHLLEEPETKRKIVAINNRTRAMDKDGNKQQRLMKEDLYDNLRMMMEKREIELLDDEDLKLSLKSVQYEILHEEKGGSRVSIFGNYTHIVEGIIRAAWARKEKLNKLWMSSIRI